MKNCLICEGRINDGVTVAELLSFKGYVDKMLCRKCQLQPNILEICHQKYIEQKDFLMKHCFATLYKPIVDCMKPKLILTYPNSEDSLFDEAAEIINCMGYKCYSLKETKIKNNTIYTEKIMDLTTTLIVIYDKINKEDYCILSQFKQIKFLFVTSGELKEL